MGKIKLFVIFLTVVLLVSCSKANDTIAVTTREDGSGARSSFEDMLQIGTNITNTITPNAIIQNGNGIMTYFINNNSSAIGYISFATYQRSNQRIRSVSIDGVSATAENITSGLYPLVRPFNLIYSPEKIGVLEEAFIAFVTSSIGYAVLTEAGVVVNNDSVLEFDYLNWELSEQTVIFGGSTSTESTAMLLMKEFMNVFPQIEMIYESVGSGAGIIGVNEGIFSLGFASRVITADEIAAGIAYVTYCLDGLVIVVNTNNEVEDLSIELLRDIYLGSVSRWSNIKNR